MQLITNANLERTWIALDQVIGGIHDWQYDRCTVAPPKGDVLAIEAETDAFRVSLRQRTAKGFADRRVWTVRFDEEFHNVTVVADVNEHGASRKDVDALNDLLWQFHRLAVEGAAAVLRN